MTREEAIAEIKERIKATEYIDGSYVDSVNIEALDMAIEALQQEPKWIPVSERLPKTGEIVLVTEMPWIIRGIDVDWWNGEQWVRNGKYVTAWQPLPEPYEESNEQ